LQYATRRIKIATINRGIAIDVAPMNSTNGNAAFDARLIDDLYGRVTPDPFDEILFSPSTSGRPR
jgi:hypothetical protein